MSHGPCPSDDNAQAIQHAAIAAGGPTPAVNDTDSEDDSLDADVAVLDIHRDRVKIQQQLADEVKYATSRKDVAHLVALKAVAAYHCMITDPNRTQTTRLEASIAVARIMYHTSKRPTVTVPTASHAVNRNHEYRGRQIRRHLLYFAQHGTLPTDRRGTGVSNPTRIHDVDFQQRCRRVISDLKMGRNKEWSAVDFRAALMKDMREDGTLDEGASISTKTVCYFLRYLGMDLVESKKGLYKDGHERADVVAHRIEYCKTMSELVDKGKMRVATRKKNCTGKDCTHCDGKECVELTTLKGQDQIVPVYHDECITSSNEGRGTYWGEKGDQFYHKTKGRSIMISGFICPCHGRMEIPKEQLKAFEVFVRRDRRHKNVSFTKSKYTVQKGPDDKSDEVKEGVHSFTTIAPGKNFDGWWTGEDVLEQVKEVIPIFEFLHSKHAQALFIFDNSTNHDCRPVDALAVGGGVNKGPGGVNAPGAWTTDSKKIPGASEATPKQFPKMRDGWYVNKDNVRVTQQMHLEDDTFKGTAAILMERGRITSTTALKGDCQANASDRDPEGKCCCKHMLASEPDFQQQASMLEELIPDLGHQTKMLPKFHPELNPIERYWAAVKEYLRRVCGYTFPDLQANVPEALLHVEKEQVLRYFRTSDRFQSMYLFEASNGIDLPPHLREYTMKKYRRHRSVPVTLLKEIQEDLTAQVVNLQVKQRRGVGKLTNVKLERARKMKEQLESVQHKVAQAGGGA